MRGCSSSPVSLPLAPHLHAREEGGVAGDLRQEGLAPPRAELDAQRVLLPREGVWGGRRGVSWQPMRLARRLPTGS